MSFVGADLRGADLRGAHLNATVLREADLRRADLSDAFLHNAVLTGANLDDVIGCDVHDVLPSCEPKRPGGDGNTDHAAALAGIWESEIPAKIDDPPESKTVTMSLTLGNGGFLWCSEITGLEMRILFGAYVADDTTITLTAESRPTGALESVLEYELSGDTLKVTGGTSRSFNDFYSSATIEFDHNEITFTRIELTRPAARR